MGNPTLTKLLFAGLIITFVAATIFGSYVNFAVLNNATIEEPYNTLFSDIASRGSDFNTAADSVKDQGLVANILNIGSAVTTGAVNVFVIGLEAMGNFFSIIPIIGDLLVFASAGIPGLSGLFGLLITITAVYVAMRYIQSVSNKPDLP